MEPSTAAARLAQYLALVGISERDFNRRTGFSNGLLGNAVKNGRALGSDKLERVIHAFPDLQPEWLLTGNGPMLRGGDASQVEGPLRRGRLARSQVPS